MGISKQIEVNFSYLIYIFKRFCVNFGLCVFDFLLHCTVKNKNPKVETGKKNILIIRPDAIGDYIVWSDSAKAYKQIFPTEKYTITFLGNPACIDLAKASGYFDESTAFDRKKFIFNLSYRISTWKMLKNTPYDTIIYPAYSQEFCSGASLIIHLKAKNKIGIVSDTAIDTAFWHQISAKRFTSLYNIDAEKLHELHKNAQFIQKLGLKDFTASLPKLVANKLSIEIKKPYFVVFPGARIGLRQWPKEKFIELINIIKKQKSEFTCVVVGSNDEFDICEQISQATQSQNLAGKTNIAQLVSVISNADFFIGNETAGIHIAIATRTPSVCIVGGGHFGRFVPYPTDILEKENTISLIAHHPMPCFHCDWNCKYQTNRNQTVPCISQVEVSTVVGLTNEILAKK